MNDGRHVEHGNLCSCRLLADIVRCKPETIRFGFCRMVLMKHWIIECNHGCQNDKPAEPGGSEKWRDIGPIDSISTILIANK